VSDQQKLTDRSATRDRILLRAQHTVTTATDVLLAVQVPASLCHKGKETGSAANARFSKNELFHFKIYIMYKLFLLLAFFI
jgi:hypothetical protein